MIKRVEWICQQPTPYNDHLFRALSAGLGLGLTVHYVRSVLSSHPWKTPMAEGYSSRVFCTTAGLDSHLIRKAGSDSEAHFVIGGWNNPTMLALFPILALRGHPYSIWTDTPNLGAARGVLKRSLRREVLNRVFAGACSVMGTGSMAIAALKEMGCGAEKLVDLPYFVDLDSFHPVPLRPRLSSSCTFVSSGRILNRDKGHDLAVRALRRVHDRLPGLDFTYRIAGSGPDLEALQQLAKKLGLSDRVEFVGWLESAQLPEFYQSGDVLLHPSRFDPFGVAVLEAMACGLAVVGSDQSGAIVDRVRDGLNGFVHKAGDEEDLAAKIILLLSADLARLKAAAREQMQKWPVSRGVDTVARVIAVGRH